MSDKLTDVLGKNKFLVSIETVKIKDFIFSANKLKLIRGASYLLDYMNQVEVPKILGKYGMEFDAKGLVNKIYDEENDDIFLEKVKSEIDTYISENILYIGAGNAKFLVDSPDKAEKICKEIKDVYKKMAPSVKVVAEYYEIKDEEKIWHAIDELAQITAEKKSEGFPLVNVDLPFAVKCDLSGSEPAVVSYKSIEKDLEKIEIHETGFGGDKEKQEKNTVKAIENVIEENKLNISEESAVKIKYSNKMIKDDVNEIGFYSIIKKALDDDIHLNTEIEDYSAGDSFIGFVYSDGDGLGDFLKNTKKIYKTEEKYLEFMRIFSVVLDRNTKYVLKKVIRELYDNGEFKKKKSVLKDGKKVGEKTVVGEFLIVGGDDVCAVFPADLAVEISERFQKDFEEKMKIFAKKEGNEENITSSCGVIIAKEKTPMFQLFDQAMGRQKAAKKKRYKENEEREKNAEKTGYIDFQVIGSEGNVDINSYRNNGMNKWSVSKRPYSINKMGDERISESIGELIEKIRELKAANFPNTKIRYIYDLKKDETRTDDEKIMEAINILSKMNENEITVLDKLWKIKDNMELSLGDMNKGFNKMFDDIFDILELYDFIRKDKIFGEKEEKENGNQNKI